MRVVSHVAMRRDRRISKGGTSTPNRLALGAAGIAAALSLPAFADNLVTNGSFEANFGAGQFNQTLPGSAGSQSAATPGTTATDWTVTGTNSSYPQGYAFIFGNADSFTTTNAGL